jgi:hypothetical protein
METGTLEQKASATVVERLLSDERDMTLLESVKFLEWSYRQTLSAGFREATELDRGDPLAGRSWCLLFATAFTAAPAFIDAVGQWKNNSKFAAALVALSVLIAVTIRAWDDHRVAYALRRAERSAAIRRIAYLSMAKWDSALGTFDKAAGTIALRDKLDTILREFREQLTQTITTRYWGNSDHPTSGGTEVQGGSSITS